MPPVYRPFERVSPRLPFEILPRMLRRSSVDRFGEHEKSIVALVRFRTFIFNPKPFSRNDRAKFYRKKLTPQVMDVSIPS
jgi:hypothetical protein